MAWVAARHGQSRRSVTSGMPVEGLSLFCSVIAAFNLAMHQNHQGSFQNLQLPRDADPLVFAGISIFKKPPRWFQYAARDETRGAKLFLMDPLLCLSIGYDYSAFSRACVSKCGTETSVLNHLEGLLSLQTPGLHCRPTESKSLGAGPGVQILISASLILLYCIWKFENYCCLVFLAGFSVFSVSPCVSIAHSFGPSVMGSAILQPSFTSGNHFSSRGRL